MSSNVYSESTSCLVPHASSPWLYLEADIFSLEMGAGREVLGPGRVTLPFCDAAGLLAVILKIIIVNDRHYPL